jgi:hypothetical protein
MMPSDKELIERALANARRRAPKRAQNWLVVSRAFGLGSTYSCSLCRRFDIDPEGYDVSLWVRPAGGL